MQTPKLNKGKTGMVILAFLLLASMLQAQKLEFERPVPNPIFHQVQIGNIDLMLAVDYQSVSDAIGKSTWWDGLSEKAQRTIEKKMQEMGNNYSYATLEEISVISTTDWKASHPPLPASRSACPSGDVILNTQDDVDAFGALGCTEVTGNLIIDDNCCSPKITDLTPLNSLTMVSGVLSIRASSLGSLDGLSNITTVGYFHVIGCNGLTDLEGLSGLTECTGPLVDYCSCSDYQNKIDDNTNLVNLSGLSNITAMGAGMYIRSNTALQNLDGLSSLGSIGGSLSLENNPALQNIHGLTSIGSVPFFLVIRNNSSLVNLNGLDNLNVVGQSMLIDNNDLLKNMEGMLGLEMVYGQLYVANNDALMNFEGMSTLETIVWGSLDVQNNAALKNFEGLSALTSIGDLIYIANNASLKTLEGLSSLTSTAGVLLEYNPTIKNVNGLEGLTTVGGWGYIFYQNQSLRDITGISNTTWIWGHLIFQELPELKNIDAVSNVTYVGGTCGIATCPQVKNIDGFSNITYVGWDGGAFDMASLENLDGFSNVTWLGGFLFVFDNPVLTSCCGIYQLLCANPPACSEDAIGAGYAIFNNPAACSNAEEIIATGPCENNYALQTPNNFLQTDNDSAPEALVYPNPATDQFDLDLRQFDDGPVIIKLFNNSGEMIWQQEVQDPTYDSRITYRATSAIPDGLYYVVVTSADEILTEPVVFQN